jgi:molecular chaperone GrpE (heat shock protein)
MGLMYGGTGNVSGGTTSIIGGGSASAGNAPNVDQRLMGIEHAGTLANIDLMKSQAEKNRAEASSIKGEKGTIGASQIESNLAEAMNKKSLAELNKLGLEIGNASKEDQIDRVHFEVENLIKRNNLNDEQAELARVQAASLGVKQQLDRANIKVSEQQARKISNDIILGWKELDATLQKIGIDNQANKLRGIEGKAALQKIANDFILGSLGKEIDLHKLNIEQQKIFASMFNSMLITGGLMGKKPTEIHNY